MSKKLTLSIDAALVDGMKKYAEENGTSISAVASEHFARVLGVGGVLPVVADSKVLADIDAYGGRVVHCSLGQSNSGVPQFGPVCYLEDMCMLVAEEGKEFWNDVQDFREKLIRYGYHLTRFVLVQKGVMNRFNREHKSSDLDNVQEKDSRQKFEELIAEAVDLKADNIMINHTEGEEKSVFIFKRGERLAPTSVKQEEAPELSTAAINRQSFGRSGYSRFKIFVSGDTGVPDRCVLVKIFNQPTPCLKKGKVEATLEDLGFTEKQAERLRKAACHPTAPVFICAPSRNGASTTLRALLSIYRQRHPNSVIAAHIEDETYRIPGAFPTDGRRLSADEQVSDFLDFGANVIVSDGIDKPSGMGSKIPTIIKASQGGAKAFITMKSVDYTQATKKIFYEGLMGMDENSVKGFLASGTLISQKLARTLDPNNKVPLDGDLIDWVESAFTDKVGVTISLKDRAGIDGWTAVGEVVEYDNEYIAQFLSAYARPYLGTLKEKIENGIIDAAYFRE